MYDNSSFLFRRILLRRSISSEKSAMVPKNSTRMSSSPPYSRFFQFLLILMLNFPILCRFVSSNPSTHHKSPFSEITTRFLNRSKEPELIQWMITMRRKIHEDPELGYEEFHTSELIRGELDKLGIHYKHPVAVTGVVGYVGTGNPPFVAIRADMDALPLKELMEWEHKSKNEGKMHGCGHDAHVAMLLGAAKILKDHEKELKGTVVLVFQPAEEGGAGAKRMIDAGALDGVVAIFGLHVFPQFPLGEVFSSAGPILAGCGFFEAVISGKGGHAAFPQQAIDPVLAASNVVVSLQHLVSREADPLDPQVITVGKFQGGDALNVIPDSVTIGGTFRAFSAESMKYMKRRIVEVIQGQAAVQRCNATIDFLETERPFFPPTVNDRALHDHFVVVASDLLGAEKVKGMRPVMGSEDFSFYQQVIPGHIFVLGMRARNSGPLLHPLHSPNFWVNEDALVHGAALHSSLAATFILNLHQKTHNITETTTASSAAAPAAAAIACDDEL